MNILVTIPVEERQRVLLTRQAPDAVFSFYDAGEVTREQVWAADVLLGNVPAALVTGAANLRWMQLNSAGADAYLAPGVFPAGAVLTNATGAYGLAIAEHLLMLTLALQKKLPRYLHNQAQGQWHDEGDVTSIFGATTLVVGLGDIGCEYAARMKALGSIVIGVRRTASARPACVDKLYTADRLDELLPRADVVALCLPGTRETAGLFDRTRLARMKPSALLLNVGRGSAVDTDALCEALEAGRLGGAGLDVTDPEPLPPDHPLWRAPNTIITPHVSGFYHLAETHERVVRIAAENLHAFVTGAPLRNVVDFETGYRTR